MVLKLNVDPNFQPAVIAIREKNDFSIAVNMLREGVPISRELADLIADKLEGKFKATRGVKAKGKTPRKHSACDCVLWLTAVEGFSRDAAIFQVAEWFRVTDRTIYSWLSGDETPNFSAAERVSYDWLRMVLAGELGPMSLEEKRVYMPHTVRLKLKSSK